MSSRGPAETSAAKTASAGGRPSRPARLRRALGALAWGSLGGLVTLTPAAEAALPVLGLWRGPLGLVWAALAVGVALAALLEGRTWPRVPSLAALTVGLALTYAVGGLWYASRLRTTGDEPHYLLMAQSLWHEGDLDLRDNYAREDYREHTPGPLPPHYGAPRADGRPYPAHSPGLPLLLAPAYALGGRLACVLLLAVVAALAALAVHRLALHAAQDQAAALVAWLAAAGPPLALYAFHVYTEAPSTLALAGSLALLLSGPGQAGAALAGLLAGCLPWLHLKLTPAAAALGLVALSRLRGRALVAFAIGALPLAAALVGYSLDVFERPTPLAVYGGVPRDMDGSPVRAAAGLLLDRSFGLLPHAPVWVLALAGGLLAARRLPALGPHLLVGAAVLLPLLPWRMWWGGQSPPARFLVPLVPLLAVLVALRTAAGRTGLVRWVAPLAGIGGAYLAWAVADPGRLLLVNRGSRPTRLWTALSGETDVGRYLPSLVGAHSDDWRVASVWLAALALLVGLDGLARRRPAVDRAFRGLLLPFVLLLAIGSAIDGWARPPGPGTAPSPVAAPAPAPP